MLAYAEAEGIRLRIDGAQTQVRRPKANGPGRRGFVSGKKRQDTTKATTISDGQGHLLWSGADRPGRMHDQTAMRTEGIAEQLRLRPKVTAEVDEGYRGLANEFPGQVNAPPRKPKADAPLGEQHAWREWRRRQSSATDLRRARQCRAAATRPDLNRGPTRSGGGGEVPGQEAELKM
ncbi:transposase family protein [Streptomyces erythrochromogenes]|uniref:transposase family protein n=1 Tax=Streptomyces erythrochromogenes TaxID=285574 RepID=UPI003425CFAA